MNQVTGHQWPIHIAKPSVWRHFQRGSAAGGTIGDWVWLDADADGVQQPTDEDVGGVVVQLRQGSTVIATVITDANGNYLFTNVVPGTYTVVFQKPSGYTFTPITNQDSKVIDFVTGSTGPITTMPLLTLVCLLTAPPPPKATDRFWVQGDGEVRRGGKCGREITG